SRLVLGFVAGAASVLVFHQGALAALHAVGLTPATAFSLQPTAPLGVPRLLSAAFWGGIWGLAFVTTDRRLPRRASSILVGALFGALGPTLVAWFVVSPLEGQPLAAGGDPRAMLTGVLVNAAWGAGTALLLLIEHRLSLERRP
ncbi:MAG: hypothetical protein ACREMC_02165, partial [Gemmatimonadales bacterium]